MNNLKILIAFMAGSAVTVICLLLINRQSSEQLMPFQTNIAQATAQNTDFRHVLFTGVKSQLVVMSIPPGGEIGQETHLHVEQILYFQSGTGEAILDGVTSKIGPGDVVIVMPGTQHNFKNTGTVPLQIFTTYAPPNHLDGRIQHTVADEQADMADEDFGQSVR